MQDPEQRTKFIHATAEKLLEFTEPLERDNYIQAVAREQMISYKDLRSLVNRLGLSRGLGERSSQNSEYGNSGSGLNGGGNRERKKKVDKDEGIRRSQRLLLTWLIEKPKLFEKIHGIIGPDDFDEPLYHQVAEMVFAEQEKGNLNPAEILNHFINDEEQYKEVAGLFHANLKESLNNEEQKKAFSDTVLKVRKHSLDEASRHAVDIVQLQKIIQEQASLKTLHIEID